MPAVAGGPGRTTSELSAGADPGSRPPVAGRRVSGGIGNPRSLPQGVPPFSILHGPGVQSRRDRPGDPRPHVRYAARSRTAIGLRDVPAPRWRRTVRREVSVASPPKGDRPMRSQHPHDISCKKARSVHRISLLDCPIPPNMDITPRLSCQSAEQGHILIVLGIARLTGLTGVFGGMYCLGPVPAGPAPRLTGRETG